jgi:pyruvate-formate lyase-activating enzyme
MNSLRRDCYDAYFRPRGYDFGDVIQSIDTALERKKFIALNNLSCPGFTDTAAEFQALADFLRKHPIHMIQWRNLNFDPLRYWQKMNRVACQGEAIGMETCLNQIREQFPKLKFGYFNPPKEKFKN